MGADQPKAFVPLSGRPLLRWCLDAAGASRHVRHIIVVVPSTHLPATRALLTASERELVDVVPGGSDRSESVARGLQALHPDDGVVLVHDAARPLAPTSLFDAIVAAVRSGHAAVVPGLPVVDTIKVVDAQGAVVHTPQRANLRAIQTPQGFLREVLQHAHEAGGSATDDAALVEANGATVLVIDGDVHAVKVTTAEDLAYAEWLIGRAGGVQAGTSTQPTGPIEAGRPTGSSR